MWNLDFVPPSCHDYISNEEVLARANVEDIEIILIRSWLRWLGHVSRMDNERPVKAWLYGELVESTRPVGRPKLRYKITCKSALKCGDVLGQWKSKVENRRDGNSSYVKHSSKWVRKDSEEKVIWETEGKRLKNESETLLWTLKIRFCVDYCL